MVVCVVEMEVSLQEEGLGAGPVVDPMGERAAAGEISLSSQELACFVLPAVEDTLLLAILCRRLLCPPRDRSSNATLDSLAFASMGAISSCTKASSFVAVASMMASQLFSRDSRCASTIHVRVHLRTPSSISLNLFKSESVLSNK